MPSPEYDHTEPFQFGGVLPDARSFDESEAVILPLPFERTTSYGSGTRNGPRELLLASAQVELWDEEVGADVHGHGMCTLPEVDLTAEPTMESAMAAIGRIAADLLSREKFLITLGGEHSITSPIVAAAAARHRGLTVLQIDAHADLRDSFMGTPHNHACAMRRTLDFAPTTQVGIRSLSPEEAADAPGLRTTIFYDYNMRADPRWIDRVVESLTDTVYITIDVDGLDPAIMPATGTPEPGGLSWYETLALLRAVIERRTVVGCDIVELSPMAGNVAPNFLCAKLIYKILSYRFAREVNR
jgi:agmatinase